MREDQFDGLRRARSRRSATSSPAGSPCASASRPTTRRAARTSCAMAVPRRLGPRARLRPLGRRRLDRRSRALAGPLRARGRRVPLRRVLPPARAGGRGRGFFDVLTHFDLPKKHGHRPATPRTRRRGRGRSRPRRRVRLRRGDLLGGPAQARRRRRTPRPRLLARIVAAGHPRHVLLRRARPGGSRLGLRPDGRRSPARAASRVRHFGRRRKVSPPASRRELRARARAKRSAEGRRRRANVA